MPIDLYHIPESYPCRAVRLVAAAIGLDLNLKFVELFKREQYKPEFLKMNPQHSVPTLDDNGFYLAESRAIATYLIEKYAKDDSLYPKDPQKRAVINQRLYFDLAIYQPLFNYFITPIYFNATPVQSDLDKINNSLEFLDKFLDGENYVAGKQLTVADIFIACTVSTFPIFDYDLGKYKNIVRWFSKVKTEIPKYEEINEVGIEAHKKLIESKKNKK